MNQGPLFIEQLHAYVLRKDNATQLTQKLNKDYNNIDLTCADDDPTRALDTNRLDWWLGYQDESPNLQEHINLYQQQVSSQ